MKESSKKSMVTTTCVVESPIEQAAVVGAMAAMGKVEGAMVSVGKVEGVVEALCKVKGVMESICKVKGVVMVTVGKVKGAVVIRVVVKKRVIAIMVVVVVGGRRKAKRAVAKECVVGAITVVTITTMMKEVPNPKPGNRRLEHLGCKEKQKGGGREKLGSNHVEGIIMMSSVSKESVPKAITL